MQSAVIELSKKAAETCPLDQGINLAAEGLRNPIANEGGISAAKESPAVDSLFNRSILIEFQNDPDAVAADAQKISALRSMAWDPDILNFCVPVVLKSDGRISKGEALAVELVAKHMLPADSAALLKELRHRLHSNNENSPVAGLVAVFEQRLDDPHIRKKLMGMLHTLPVNREHSFATIFSGLLGAMGGTFSSVLGPLLRGESLNAPATPADGWIMLGCVIAGIATGAAFYLRHAKYRDEDLVSSGRKELAAALAREANDEATVTKLFKLMLRKDITESLRAAIIDGFSENPHEWLHKRFVTELEPGRWQAAGVDPLCRLVAAANGNSACIREALKVITSNHSAKPVREAAAAKLAVLPERLEA